MRSDSKDLLLMSEGKYPHGHHIFRYVVPFLLVVIALGVGLYINNSSKHKRPADKLLSKDIKFEMVESSPDNQSISFPVTGEPTFVFSKPLSIKENEINKYFSITPSISGSWHLEKNQQVITFTSGRKQADKFPQLFEYDTVYKITMREGIKSGAGETIEKGKTIAFRTNKPEGSTLNSNYKLINLRPNETGEIELYYENSPTQAVYMDNTEPVHVSVYSATVDQVISYFQYNSDNKWSNLYYFDKKADQHELLSFDVQPRLSETPNTSRNYLDIPSFEKAGIYYVKLENRYGKDDLIVSVSDHVNQTFFDSGSSVVWTTDAQGISLADVAVEYYSLKDNPRLIKNGKTDGDGIYKSTNDSAIDLVITRAKQDYAITYTDRYYESAGHNFSAYAYTDRPVYRPGDTVHTKAILRLREDGIYTIPKGSVYYQYLDSSYSEKEEKYKKLTIDETGTVNADVELPKEIHGFPRIIFYTKNKATYSQIYTKELIVESYQKPDLEVTVTTTDIEYISKDTAHFTLYAKTLYGQPLTNVEFTYRVITNSYYENRDRRYESPIDSSFSYYGYGEDLAAGSGSFNDKGKADINFSTDLGKLEQSQTITVEVTPNIGAAPSIGKIVRLVHRGEFAIFFEQIQGTVENGITGTVYALDHGKDRKAYTKTSLDVSLYKIVSYNAKNLLTTKSASISADGSFPIDFQYKDLGDYEIVAQGKDPRGNTVTAKYTVYIGRNSDYVTEKPDAYIEMEANKSSYMPGEEAVVTVKANYDLSDAAIFFASNSNYQARINTLVVKKKSPDTFEIKVPIDKDAISSVGINLFSVHKSKIIEAHTGISVNTKSKQLKTFVSFDKSEYKPGDTVKATINTKDADNKPVSADTSLAVIDNSVLQIAQLTGDIFSSFYTQNDYSTYITHFDSLTGIYNRGGGGGGGGCFLTGTDILMADGSYKNIEDIVVGDHISTLSTSSTTDRIEDTVTKTFRHIVDEYLTINSTLHITPVHRIYLNRHWQTASEARVGDSLLDQNGKTVIITSITRHTGQFEVYNFTTNVTHTFIAENIYVHNDKGMEPRHSFVDTAYWNPHIKTDSQGTATVSFELPDNTTTFATQIVAVTNNSQFGQSSSEFISKKDVVIIPALARFYYEKDKPTISAVIQNNSGKEIKAIMKLTIKELKEPIEKKVTIDNNELATVSIPVSLDTNSSAVHITYELKDAQSGKILDSVLIKEPILPRENIIADWKAYSSSFSYTYEPPHRSVDINTVRVEAVPHFASSLAYNNYYDISAFYDYSSGTDPLHIYTASLVVAQTLEGNIAPSLYKYAHTKNNVRNKIGTLLEKHLLTGRRNIWWTQPDSYNNESDGLYTTLIGIAFKEALANGTLNDISNAQDIVNRVAASVSNNEVTFLGTDEESVLKRWLLGYGSGDDCNNAYKTSCYASKAVRGDKKALETLRTLNVPSSDDRYFWSTPSRYTRGLAALAMVLYGTKSDADKAIKGVSYQYGSAYYGQIPYMALVASVKHALRRNLDFDKPVAIFTLNEKKVHDWSEGSYYNSGLSTAYHAVNFENSKIKLSMENTEGLPIYTSLATTTLSPDTKTSNDAKHVLTSFLRSYRSSNDGKRVHAIETGHSGIIELMVTNPITNIYEGDDLDFTSFHLYDMIPPGYMYLNQSSENSPQYQTKLRNIYPDVGAYKRSYIEAGNYSDQSVYFRGDGEQGTLILPYMVYHISEGDVYQPKTFIIFPKLGVIADEK